MVDLKVTNKKLKSRAINIISDITKLSIKESGDLLKAARNDVKAALVINHSNISYEAACKLIKLNKGRLRDILN